MQSRPSSATNRGYGPPRRGGARGGSGGGRGSRHIGLLEGMGGWGGWEWGTWTGGGRGDVGGRGGTRGLAGGGGAAAFFGAVRLVASASLTHAGRLDARGLPLLGWGVSQQQPPPDAATANAAPPPQPRSLPGRVKGDPYPRPAIEGGGHALGSSRRAAARRTGSELAEANLGSGLGDRH